MGIEQTLADIVTRLGRIEDRLVHIEQQLRTPAPPRASTRTRPHTARLLDKWAVEQRTALDITTIYRKMRAGTFPAPVRIGKRRVAWREADLAAWEARLPSSREP